MSTFPSDLREDERAVQSCEEEQDFAEAVEIVKAKTWLGKTMLPEKRHLIALYKRIKEQVRVKCR